MCRMTIETNMRAEEVVLFRADQIPGPDDETKGRPDAQTIIIEILGP